MQDDGDALTHALYAVPDVALPDCVPTRMFKPCAGAANSATETSWQHMSAGQRNKSERARAHKRTAAAWARLRRGAATLLFICVAARGRTVNAARTLA